MLQVCEPCFKCLLCWVISQSCPLTCINTHIYTHIVHTCTHTHTHTCTCTHTHARTHTHTHMHTHTHTHTHAHTHTHTHTERTVTQVVWSDNRCERQSRGNSSPIQGPDQWTPNGTRYTTIAHCTQLNHLSMKPDPLATQIPSQLHPLGAVIPFQICSNFSKMWRYYIILYKPTLNVGI